MAEDKKEIFVPVPLHIVQKEARYSRLMKKILVRFMIENKMPGTQNEYTITTDHNKAYELEEKKKQAEKLDAEIKDSVKKTVPDQLKAAKDKDAANNKKRG